MLIPPFQPKLPEIAGCDQTPVVRSLLQVIADLQAQVQRLEDELRRLQGGPPRPQLRPNTLEPAGPEAAADGDAPRRRGPRRAKTAELKMDATERVPLADVPDGAVFKGYRRFVVQDLEIRPHNTCYLLEQWRFPTGEYVTAPAPTAVRGGHYGPQLVSYVLHQLGIEWNSLLNSRDAMTLIVMAAVWKQISYNFLFFLAGLQSIPKSLIEAAAIDGAGPWRRFWTIVFPLLSPTTFFLLVINIVYAFFDTFAIVDAATQGGPGKDTAILVYKVYYDGFKAMDLGGSAAQSVVLMVIVIALTVVQFRYVEKKVNY